MRATGNAWQTAQGAARAAERDEYRLMIWKADRIERLAYTDPVDAIVAAIGYLKAGYQCRLGGETVDAFRAEPVTRAAWFPSVADWKLINGVLGRALTIPGFFHADAATAARARVERLRVQIGDTIDRIARQM
jgi:hypothetical protein